MNSRVQVALAEIVQKMDRRDRPYLQYVFENGIRLAYFDEGSNLFSESVRDCYIRRFGVVDVRVGDVFDLERVGVSSGYPVWRVRSVFRYQVQDPFAADHVNVKEPDLQADRALLTGW